MVNPCSDMLRVVLKHYDRQFFLADHAMPQLLCLLDTGGVNAEENKDNMERQVLLD